MTKYLQLSFRIILKFWGFSIINIIGFSIGIAAAVHIYNYCFNELNYDDFHKNADHIFLVGVDLDPATNNSKFKLASTPNPLAKELLKYSEVEASFRLYYQREIKNNLIFGEGKAFKIENPIGADQEAIDNLTLSFLHGSPHSVFKGPSSAIITTSLSKKIFGIENSIDSTFKNQHGQEFKVTGVIQDYPVNSHIKFDVLYSLKSFSIYNDTLNWSNHAFYTYVKLKEGTDWKEFAKKLTPLADRYINQLNSDNQSWQDTTYSYFITPLKKIYLSDFFNYPVTGKRTTIYILFSLGFVILLIAGLNYINLSMAQSVNRFKEIYIKKVSGASKKYLIFQFLSESATFSFCGLIFGMLIFEYTLPVINKILGQQYVVNYLNHPLIIPGLLALALLIGLFAGIYPAIILSSFSHYNPSSGKTDYSYFKFYKSNRTDIRDALVVMQLVVCMIIIVASLVIHRQINYMKWKQKEEGATNVVVLYFPDILKNTKEKLKLSLLRNKDIISVSYANNLPLNITIGFESKFVKAKNEGFVFLNAIIGDRDLPETLGLEIVEGKSFLEDNTGERFKIMVNETFVERTNLNKPVNKYIKGSPFRGLNKVKYKIIGVFKDFHYSHLREKIENMVIFPYFESHSSTNYVLLRLRDLKNTETIKFIEQEWKKHTSNYPFYYSSLNDEINKLYERELRMEKLLKLFAFLAIFITSLGFYGLAIYIINSRKKSMSIRKTLGASVGKIRFLLIRQFLFWIIIATIIAWPSAYIIMDNWLNGFAYHINLDFLPFLISILVPILIFTFFISYHIIKISNSNPAENLKTE